MKSLAFIINSLDDPFMNPAKKNAMMLVKQYEHTMKSRKEKIELLESLVEEGSTLNKKYYDENKQQTFVEWYMMEVSVLDD